MTGSEPAIQALLGRLRRGPLAARVEDLTWEPIDAFETEDFEIRR